MKHLISFFGRIVLFCIPFFILFLVYILYDPFMVLYDYEDYNQSFYINKNNDFVATEKYLNNSRFIDYDSFIIGSSTARFFSPAQWKKYLGSCTEAFCFDASSEHLNGIWSKIKYIDSHHKKIRNILLIFDTDATFRKFENDSPLIMKHYKFYPSSRYKFHYRFFLNFIDIRFLVRLVQFKITGEYRPYMEGYLINEYYHYDNITNEYYNTDILQELKADSLNYYIKRSNHFESRTGKYSEYRQQITKEDTAKLYEIKNIFLKQRTNYRIIIGPAYNQISFNKQDLSIIQNIFGNDKVYDFTGINPITEVKSNFYDTYHFKKYVAKELLDIVYKMN